MNSPEPTSDNRKDPEIAAAELLFQDAGSPASTRPVWTGDRYRLQRGIRTRRRRPALHVASAEFAVRSIARSRKR